MPLASDVDIYAGQRPDEDPSLAVRNNGGTPPPSAPAPPGRREALLVLSFGGPEGHDDVLPFLENVTRGRGIPRERLAAGGQDHPHRRDTAREPRGGVRALPPLRRRQSDNSAEQGVDRRGRGRLHRARP